VATCTELYIDTLGGLDLDGSTDKNLPQFVVENLATLVLAFVYCSAVSFAFRPVVYATFTCTVHVDLN